jgi:hypothetical protein
MVRELRDSIRSRAPSKNVRDVANPVYKSQLIDTLRKRSSGADGEYNGGSARLGVRSIAIRISVGGAQ